MSIKYCTCGSLTQVVDSRPTKAASIWATGTIRRRRECPKCLKRSTTIEISLVKFRQMKEIAERYDVIKGICAYKLKSR